MNKSDGGVLYYAKGAGTVEVYFPNGELLCQHCRFCRAESDLRRFWCRLTEREIYNPFFGIEGFCPLKFEEKEQGPGGARTAWSTP